MIASPVLVHTPTISASELLGSAATPLCAIESSSGRYVFVCSIDTVWIAITDPLLGNALRFSPLLVGTTGEFRFGVALARSTLMTLILVRVIETVIISIANVDSWNAVAVIARKQVTEAGLCARFTIIGRLIGSVSTIVVSIAVPGSGNAAIVGGASETVGGTRALRTSSVVFVRIVAAIVVSVTKPKRFDANIG